MKRTAFRIAATAFIAGAITAPQLPALAAPRATPAISIVAKSQFPKVTRDVYVTFGLDSVKSATISGKVTGGATGEVLRLYAQQFPFKKAPAVAGHMPVSGATQPYSFTVTPTLATRYQVKLFKTSSAHTSLAASEKVIVYVTANRQERGGDSCNEPGQRPVCHQTWHVHVFVPPSTLRTEMPKRWFVYFGIKLSPTGEPSPPKFLKLGAGNPRVSKPQKINAHEYALTIKFTFRIGNNGYFYEFDPCQRDTQARDGLNLPGHHGCGTLKVIGSKRQYIG
jgi:hypothetical protein